ncbi:MAG: serine hydrolase [Deltaproteobacteria bacterium]|nr:serine hydrolase [Deltaproteobacteria bacterium]
MTQTAPGPWSNLNALLKEGLGQGVYTAAVALVGLKGELLWEGFAGRVSNDPEADPVTRETVFDLASLTKPLATALGVLCLLHEGKLALDAPLGEVLPFGWLPEDKKPVTIENLLTHRSGLPAWRPFYEQLLKAPAHERRQLLPRLAAAEPLERPPDTVTLYSDLGFMLLAAVVETVSGLSMDRFCEERIYYPLGLKILGFKPLPILTQEILPTENRKPKTENRIYAATEAGLIPHRPMAGEVHDENAWAAGGVAGHSGLFGPGFEVFNLIATLYRAYHGEPIKGFQPFPPELVRRFFTPIPGGRALGFDVPGADAAQCSPGRFFSPHSVGHLGFTGASFWLDLELGQMVVLLTNRVHLGRDDKTRIQSFRPRFHEAASLALGFTRTFRR